MIQKTEKKGHMTSVLFTMLLFLVFVLSALFTVLIGSRVYENITVRSDASYTGNTALSYIANKVRQGDRAGLVDVVDIDGIPVLEAGNRGFRVCHLDLLEGWDHPGVIYRYIQRVGTGGRPDHTGVRRA